MTIYIDTGDGYPSGAEIAAAGVAGVIGYVGTPGRRKNLTSAVVADYRTHGVSILAVYEDTANDVAAGRSAGVGHAQAALADMRAMGLPDTTPVCAAADEHLTAAMIPTATAYQAGFYSTVRASEWAGPVGGYGFSEFIAAIRTGHIVDWTWQCGAHPSAGSGVNVWQRNGSNGELTQMTVGGITVDIDDLLVLIQGDDMSWTDNLTNPHDAAQVERACDLLWEIDLWAARNGAALAGMSAAVAAATSNPAITAEALQQMIDTAVAQHVQITGTVQVGPAPTVPTASATPAATA